MKNISPTIRPVSVTIKKTIESNEDEYEDEYEEEDEEIKNMLNYIRRNKALFELIVVARDYLRLLYRLTIISIVAVVIGLFFSYLHIFLS